jgi:hypothetical protein
MPCVSHASGSPGTRHIHSGAVMKLREATNMTIHTILPPNEGHLEKPEENTTIGIAYSDRPALRLLWFQVFK